MSNPFNRGWKKLISQLATGDANIASQPLAIGKITFANGFFYGCDGINWVMETNSRVL